MLGLSRSSLNALAQAGAAPGLLRKEPGGYANRGRYLFDAEVIEQVVRDRIAALEAVLEQSADDEMRAAS
jgi:hypothetical protein